MSALPARPVLSLHEVAEWLGVSESTARRYYKAGLLPAPVIVGRVVPRWRRTDLLAWAGMTQ